MINEIINYLKDRKRCRSCEVLERQLLTANEQVRTLQATIINIANPAPAVVNDDRPSEPAKLHTPRTMGTLRHQLEQQSKENADRIRKTSTVISNGKPAPINTPSPEQLKDLADFLEVELAEGEAK